MDTGEEHYIHLNGEQRGPFTLSEIKHMYDRNFIPEETLYWNDNMEQWRHVSDLCGPPAWVIKSRRWFKPASALVFLVVVAALALLFLPVTIEAWQESSQREYTKEAAYWKAREYVRTLQRDKADYVIFKDFAPEHAVLDDDTGAVVELSGETVTGKKATQRRWKVHMRYHPQNRDWTGENAVDANP